MARRRRIRTADPFKPSLRLGAELRRRLDGPIADMTVYTASALANAGPDDYGAIITQLRERFGAEFNDLGPDLAQWFTQQTNQRNIEYYDRIRGRLPVVDIEIADAMRPQVQRMVLQSTERFTSIPDDYFTGIMDKLSRALYEEGSINPYDVYQEALTHLPELSVKSAERRAWFIARNTNSYLTGEVNRHRSMELGIKTGIWVHSNSRRYPRPSHLKAGQEQLPFDLDTGAYLWEGSPRTGRYLWVWPGQLFNCGCVYRPVIPY